MSYMRKGHADSKSRDDRKPSLTITVPTTLCGMSKSETFVLMIGSGDTAGKLRIKGEVALKGDKKPMGVKPAQMKHAFRWNFGYVLRLGDDHFDGERCLVRKISDEEFELDVKADWFAA